MNPDTMISNSAITTVPGASATVILFDTTDSTTTTPGTKRRGYSLIRRAVVTIETDQAATFYHSTCAASGSTWDVINGSGSGESITANTLFERDCLFIGDDTQLKVVTGSAPSVWRVSVRLVPDRALAQ